ncbi:hypothetical protein PN450_10085 [Dolichospermum lemmermannii CS-548]|uniref:hypothetical protein n=1 Tax=Dolichospermum lemmermannii TaxID=54295 RepID=UPI0023306702|nr:hypothetical protein [Dolichospermum lemmermannii]MDB9437142.1 hypothetical protein [Dolichospermum lemmermannii CS-548]
MKPLLLVFSLLSFNGMVDCFNYLSTNVHVQASSHLQSKAVKKKVMIKVSLLSQENKLPPIGIPPQPNRDIGFATVFISLENHQQKNQTVIIKKIEVRNVSDHKLQSFSFQPKQIELKPLENSVIDIHLTNKIGYAGKDRVKAIITYQIGSQVNKIESEAVEVDRH